MVIFILNIYIYIFKLACPENCKCRTGGVSDGGEAVNGQGYCEYHCSTKGYCGASQAYLTGTDCTGCKSKGKKCTLVPI